MLLSQTQDLSVTIAQLSLNRFYRFFISSALLIFKLYGLNSKFLKADLLARYRDKLDLNPANPEEKAWVKYKA